VGEAVFLGGPLCGTAKCGRPQYGTSFSILYWGISFRPEAWLMRGEFEVPYGEERC